MSNVRHSKKYSLYFVVGIRCHLLRLLGRETTVGEQFRGAGEERAI
jgi:hypothetical protein